MVLDAFIWSLSCHVLDYTGLTLCSHLICVLQGRWYGVLLQFHILGILRAVLSRKLGSPSRTHKTKSQDTFRDVWSAFSTASLALLNGKQGFRPWYFPVPWPCF